MQTIMDDNGNYFSIMDAGPNTLHHLNQSFFRQYRGNKAPFGLYNHGVCIALSSSFYLCVCRLCAGQCRGVG